MFTTGFRKLLCPYCLREFNLREAVYQCSTGCTLDDAVYEREWGDGSGAARPRMMSPAKAGRSNGVACPECGVETHTRACVHCHKQIPDQLWEGKTEYFSLVGGASSGKSHFLGAAVCDMRDSLGSDVGFHLELLGDRAMETFERDYYVPIYGRKTTLDATKPEQKRGDVRDPVALRLAMPKGKAVHVLMYDAAGENFQSERRLARYSAYLFHSTGIVFLINPLRIEPIVQLINQPLDTLGESPDATLSRLVQKLRTARGLREGEKIDVPVAMVVSKADLLCDIVDPEALMLQPTQHEGGANLRDLVSLDREVRSYLEKWGQKNLVKMADWNFNRCSFFATSSIGAAPVNKTLATLKPHRVSDPLAWLLYERGHIDGIRRAF